MEAADQRGGFAELLESVGGDRKGPPEDERHDGNSAREMWCMRDDEVDNGDERMNRINIYTPAQAEKDDYELAVEASRCRLLGEMPPPK